MIKELYARGEIEKRHNGKSFCICLYCCNTCKGTKFIKLTRIHDDGTPFIPLQEIIVYCHKCFGTGKNLTSDEYLELAKKQREREEDKKREKEGESNLNLS
jgi:hypothetical protein